MRMPRICLAQMGEKMWLAGTVDILQIRQAKIKLIDKCGGLQPVAVAFVSHALLRRPMELMINLGCSVLSTCSLPARPAPSIPVISAPREFDNA